MAKKASPIEWKMIGKILLITLGIILLVEFYMYSTGNGGGNIIRMIMGEALV